MKADWRTQKHQIACLALQASNKDLEARITHICGSVNQLNRELSALSRHINQFSHHPFLETWQADLLTRLIEVAYVRQRNKLPPGVSIGEKNIAEREVLSRAYGNAARRVKWGTLDSLGLDIRHHDALQRYSDVSWKVSSPLLLAMKAIKAQHFLTPQVYRSLFIGARIPSTQRLLLPNGWSSRVRQSQTCSRSGQGSIQSAMAVPFTKASFSTRR